LHEPRGLGFWFAWTKPRPRLPRQRVTGPRCWQPLPRSFRTNRTSNSASFREMG
jgi:hypothetical protein